MIDDVLGIPDQLRDALWRIESARLEPAEAAGVIVCGMGGSAIGADLAAAALGDRLTRPLVTIRGYGLPSWATPEWTVLCSSYSGNTEETLACFEAAEALGARRIVASTGGALVDGAREAGLPVVGLPGIFQPRAAVAYMFTVVAEVAALAGAAPRVHTEIDAAAAFLEREAEALQARAAEIAAQLEGSLAGRLRRRPDGAGGAPLEVPGQRERQAPRLLLRAARGRPQRALRLGRARRRPRRRLPRGLRPAPADAPPLRADRRGRSPATAPPRSGSRPPARPASPACSGRRCWATWSRSSWPRRAGWTRSRSRRSSASRRRWGRYEGDGPGGRPGHPPAADHLRDAEADGAGAEPAGDGAHPAPARPPRLHRDDRQPALVPGADRGPLRRRLRSSASSSPTASRSSCSAPPAASATPPASSATPSSSSPATPSPTST